MIRDDSELSALTVFVHEGRGFQGTSRIWLQATFFEEQVRCLPVTLRKWGKTKFLSELTWHLSRQHMHSIKSEKCVLKLEVFTNMKNDSINRLIRIGYVLISLQFIPMYPGSNLSKPVWYRVYESPENTAELCISCGFGLYAHLRNQIRDFRAQHEHEVPSMPFNLEYINRDYYQIEQGGELYTLKLFLSLAENLYSFLSADSQEPVYFYYSFLGRDIMTSKYVQADRIEFSPETNTSIFKLRTPLTSLHLFLRYISPLSVYLCQGQKVSGIAEISFKTSMDFIEKQLTKKKSLPQTGHHRHVASTAKTTTDNNEFMYSWTEPTNSPEITIQVEDMYRLHAVDEPKASLIPHEARETPWIGVHYVLSNCIS